jgi:membrane associated rhomboid family serine protease
MIPISDENPAQLRPFVTWAIMILCVVAFFWQLSFSETAEERLIEAYGFTPANLFDTPFELRLYGIPWAWLTLITSMFLHGGFLHLGGNMLYLWIFGNNVEDAMGHGRFVLFYFAGGIAAALAQGFAEPHSLVPMLGASGAISGVLGSYAMIFPRARVNVVIPLGIVFYPVKISAMYVIGFWFLLQLFNVLGVGSGTAGGTAFWAHIGGFFVGVALTPLLSHFPLFGRRPPGPWS